MAEKGNSRKAGNARKGDPKKAAAHAADTEGHAAVARKGDPKKAPNARKGDPKR